MKVSRQTFLLLLVFALLVGNTVYLSSKLNTLQNEVEACRRSIQTVNIEADLSYDTYDEVRDYLQSSAFQDAVKEQYSYTQPLNVQYVCTMDDGAIGFIGNSEGAIRCSYTESDTIQLSGLYNIRDSSYSILIFDNGMVDNTIPLYEACKQHPDIKAQYIYYTDYEPGNKKLNVRCDDGSIITITLE